MADPKPGIWTQVQLSGSNFYARELSITASNNSDTNCEVVVWNTTDKKLYSTSSYKLAGNNNPLTANWFPYNGNVNIEPDLYFATQYNRTLLLRQTSASLSGNPNTIGDGVSRLYFLTSGTLAGATIDDWTLRITRGGGANSATTFHHNGTGDVIFKFMDEQGSETTSVFKKVGDYTNNSVYSPVFSGTSNLETTSGTNSASLASGTYTNVVLAFYFDQIPQQFDVPLDAEFMGARFLIREWIDTTYAQVTWSYFNPNNEVYQEIESYTVTNTTIPSIGGTDGIRYIGSYTTSSWGLSPQPGNDVVYISDWVNTDVFNSLTITMTDIFVHSIGGVVQKYNILGGTLCPRLSVKYKTKEGEIKFVDATGDVLFSVNGSSGVLKGEMAEGDGTADKVYVYNNGNTFEFVTELDIFDPSTKRLKTNIQDYTGSLLDNFDKLRPVTFNFTNRDDKSTHGGFIAEEIAQLSPSSVTYDYNYKVNNGYLDVKSPPIDNTLVPIDIKDRDIMAAAVAKLNQLDKELDYL